MSALAAESPLGQLDASALEASLRAALHVGSTPAVLSAAIEATARHHRHLGLHLALAEAAEAACRPEVQKRALEQAIAICRLNLATHPRDWGLHQTLGRLFYRLGRFEEAWNTFERLHRHRPEDPAALFDAVRAGLPIGRWESLSRLDVASIPLLVASGQATASNLIAIPINSTAPSLLSAGRIESQRIATGLHRLPPRQVHSETPLRVGYVSPDINDHAVAHQIPRVLELHDRTRLRVYAYDIGHDDGSPYRQRILSACDTVRDCRRLDDSAAAAIITSDEIDILVDLAGHTVGSRLGIFARRPAPIQVSWLGYPATTGASFIDYLIGDRIVVAPDLRAHFSEAIAYLPDCYLPADDRQLIAPIMSRTQAGLPTDAVVLAAIHQPYKLEPGIVGTWLRILQRAPKTVLWLRAKEESLQERLQAEAVRYGIDQSRLLIDNQLLPKPKYLARLALADLFLDTHWFNGHSTVSDALWAGVPVLTIPGDAFAGRVAASILAASDLDDLIVPDLAAYEALATRLASDRSALAALRARVAHARVHANFFDPCRFTMHLESAYSNIAARCRDGLPPADFAVSPTSG